MSTEHAHHKLCNQRTDPHQCSDHLTSRYIFYMDSIDRKSMQHDACIATENIHRLDPAQFPAIHSLEKPPFLAKPELAPNATTGGMPYGNAMFAYLWFTTFTKHVNICPSANTSLGALLGARSRIQMGPPQMSTSSIIIWSPNSVLQWPAASARPPLIGRRRRIISVCRRPLFMRQKKRARSGENSSETALRSGNLSSLT